MSRKSRTEVEASVASLSAILMDEGYYELVLSSRYDADGVPMVGADGLAMVRAPAMLVTRTEWSMRLALVDSHQ